jgi:thioester reductase-like protein
MTSFRTPDDRNWSYMRPLPTTKPYLRFDAIGDGMFECVVLDGLPTKVVSNSDDPPNSFRTRDTFTPHPRIPGSWKYVGRLDDRITLENGEKVLPVPYEHFIRQSELVDDCLVFGIGRSFPGILVVKSDKTIGASNEQCLENLWPVIQTANSMTERFGQVSREMVAILDVDTDYPRTDKGTMIRAACYRKFEKVINTVYDRFDKADESINGGLAKLDLPGLQEFLFNLFNNVLGLKCLELETDFFDAGTDSLQSIAARGHIMRQIDLSGHILGQNVVFEHSSIQKLADHLYFLVTGSASGKKDEIEIMQDLIEKYSVFPEFYPGDNIPQEDVVVLTGATGSLGAHILSQLITLPNVAAVYCLVRAKSEEDANSRVLSALTSRKLDTLPHQDKIHAVPSDLSKSELGIPTSTFAYLQQNVTTVIHSAWAVNFNLGVASFESQHIRGTYNLLRLCQSVPFPRPANFAFISSISAAAGTSIPAVIEETYLADPTQAQNMGYARSKFVTEYVVRAAASTTPQHARVLRTGQIVGDTAQGLWNITEAIPLMIQSAVTMGVLPRLDETPSWLPVDKCAEAIIDLAEVRIPFSITLKSTPGGYCKEVVYHVQNPATLSWTEDLLPALSEAGLKFQTVSQQEWIAALRDGEQDPKRNPTVKLIDFFVEKYDNDRPGRRSLVFNTEKTAKKSKVIHDGIDVIGSGLVTKYVNAWNQVWYACDTNMR